MEIFRNVNNVLEKNKVQNVSIHESQKIVFLKNNKLQNKTKQNLGEKKKQGGFATDLNTLFQIHMEEERYNSLLLTSTRAGEK